MVRKDGAKNDWLCKHCKRGSMDDPLSNSGTRQVCRGCNVAKGSCYLRDGPSNGKGKGKGAGKSFAERQVQQQQQQQKQQPQLQQQNKELAALRKKVTALEAAAKGEGGVAGDTEEDDTGKDKGKHVEALRAAVAHLEGLPDEVALPEALEAARARLAVAIQKRDEGKQPATRVMQAKHALARREKALEKATSATSEAAANLEAAQASVVTARKAEAGALAAVVAAKADFSSAAARCADGAQDSVNGAPDAALWDTITAVLTQLHQLPGAMAAGNGNSAWLHIQENGLRELQAEAERRAADKLQKSVVDASPQVQQQIAPLHLLRKKPAPKFDGFTGKPIPQPDEMLDGAASPFVPTSGTAADATLFKSVFQG